MAFVPRVVGVAACFSLVLGGNMFAQAPKPPLLLTCETTHPDDEEPNYIFPVKFRIDLAERIVELLVSDGSVIASTTDTKHNARAPSVTITPALIRWDLSNDIGFLFEGSIDRESGNANAAWINSRDKNTFFRGRCRLAPLGPKF